MHLPCNRNQFRYAVDHRQFCTFVGGKGAFGPFPPSFHFYRKIRPLIKFTNKTSWHLIFFHRQINFFLVVLSARRALPEHVSPQLKKRAETARLLRAIDRRFVIYKLKDKRANMKIEFHN